MKRVFGISLLLVLTFSAYSQLGDTRAKPKQPDLKGDLLLDFGFTLMSDQPEQLPSHTWGSNSVGLYYIHRLRLNDHISFYPGAGLTFDKYSFKNNGTWLRGSDGDVSLDSIGGGVNLTKNKLVVSYLEVPLEFRIHPLGTVNGEGWFIGMGVVGGLRFGAHTKIKFSRNGDDNKEKLYNDFGLSQFRYGFQVRFGFKSINLFYKQYLTDLFKDRDDFDDSNPKAATIGISFSAF